MRSFLVLMFSGVIACAGVSATASELATFYFTAERRIDPTPNFPMPRGQRINGSYSFEVVGQGGSTTNTTYTTHSDVVTEMTFEVPGFGTGSGQGGTIQIGAPVNTIARPFNFLSDQYRVTSFVSGISLNTSRGLIRMTSASLRLRDIDQEALDSEALSSTPPDLALFTDNEVGTGFAADEAEFLLIFGLAAYPFEVTYLSTTPPIPEPTTASLLLTCIVPAVLRRRR